MYCARVLHVVRAAIAEDCGLDWFALDWIGWQWRWSGELCSISISPAPSPSPPPLELAVCVGNCENNLDEFSSSIALLI